MRDEHILGTPEGARRKDHVLFKGSKELPSDNDEVRRVGLYC
jgi:hypothetical protein